MSARGASSCDGASSGYFVSSSAATEQVACPAGEYSLGGSVTACSLCADEDGGKYQPLEGQSECQPAEPGYFVSPTDATQQVPCGAGNYSLGNVNQCQRCAVGYHSSGAAPACTLAQPGTVTNTNQSGVLECSAGEYAAAGSTQCTACDSGYWASAKSEVCNLAQPGTAINGDQSGIINCTAGEYAVAGADQCEQCGVALMLGKFICHGDDDQRS